jgi:hypothetical protein
MFVSYKLAFAPFILPIELVHQTFSIPMGQKEPKTMHHLLEAY